MRIIKSTYLLIVILLVGCKYESKDQVVRQEPFIDVNVILSKGSYKREDVMSVTIALENKSDETTVIEDLGLRIVNISDGLSSLTRELKEANFKWKARKKHSIVLDIAIPKHFKEGAYGVYSIKKEKGLKEVETYQTFFRIINDDELTVFEIETERINNVPIYKLDGGMSAEYIVEKSAENLTSGISHSWKVNGPGSGPNHVLGTPNYLEESINETVGFYNDTFGEDAEIETVMISTGFPSIPYISNALKSPVLPLHFLVSVNTVKEIQTILKTANDKGIASYATLSHDPSVPYAVSWIKLLELPKAYTDFIKNHKVKNVVILGATGTSGGETKAKQLAYDDTIRDEYANRSIYIMYPGTSPDDVKTLNEKIIDLKDFKQQESFIRIVDWESGINQKQLTNFSKNTKTIDNEIRVVTITAEDLTHLYNLGSYSVLALMNKNKDKFDGIKGVVFNPYLISHPVIEAKKGFIPLLYWQLVGAKYTVDRLENNVFKAIKYYYPNTKTQNLKFWLNSTRNFGASWSAENLKKELLKKEYSNFIENDYSVDEVWDLSDGVESSSELLYKDISNSFGFDNLKIWNDSLIPLTILDIEKTSKKFGGFKVQVN